jgi:superfamily II DNA or RNA helicase
MLIVDECHGARGNSLRGMITDQAARIPYRFGFTGTLPEDESQKLQVHTALGPVRNVMPAADLIEQGVLADLHISVLQLEEDLQEEYQLFCDEECINLTPPSYAEFKADYFPDYASERSYRSRNRARSEWIASCVEQQRDAAKGNTLVLVDNIPSARLLAKMIPGAYLVNGTDMADTSKRQEVYNLFATRDDLVVVATVNVAGTGLSINRIFNLVLVDIGKSFIRVIQAIGRGLRKAHDKDFVNVIDICGDFKYSKQHLAKRVKFYREAGYSYKKHKVNYTK